MAEQQQYHCIANHCVATISTKAKRDALPGVNWLIFLVEAMKTTYNTALHTPSMQTSERNNAFCYPTLSDLLATTILLGKTSDGVDSRFGPKALETAGKV